MTLPYNFYSQNNLQNEFIRNKCIVSLKKGAVAGCKCVDVLKKRILSQNNAASQSTSNMHT